MSGILDTGGFSKDYYIRVQRNMIEAGIRDKAQYADLYIDGITTDPTMQTLCECCSDMKGDGKKQYIKWLFHVKSRKDPNFHMVIGSTCIHQYEGIDPDELKYCLLLFEQEKKKIEKRRREDARKARVKEYAEKYSGYIEYLKKYYELRHVYPEDLYEVYQILVEGKKIFRQQHESVIRDYMDRLSLQDIQMQLEEREKRRLEEQKHLEEWFKKREEEERQRRLEILQNQSDRLNKVLQRDPNNTYVQSLLQQVQGGQQLTFGQLKALEDIERRLNSQPTFEQKVQQFLQETDNSFVRKMYSLMKRNVSLTAAQRQTVERILSQYEAFRSKYAVQHRQLQELSKVRMNSSQKKRFDALWDEFKRAAGFGRFYNENAEKRFLNRLQKLYEECTALV